ncbi:hypothetical protein BDZ91DRAFT_731306, partial [Kalaharituber pfeilii]
MHHQSNRPQRPPVTAEWFELVSFSFFLLLFIIISLPNAQLPIKLPLGSRIEIILVGVWGFMLGC